MRSAGSPAERVRQQNGARQRHRVDEHERIRDDRRYGGSPIEPELRQAGPRRSSRAKAASSRTRAPTSGGRGSVTTMGCSIFLAGSYPDSR